jgi:hypothetical protein
MRTVGLRLEQRRSDQSGSFTQQATASSSQAVTHDSLCRSRTISGELSQLSADGSGGACGKSSRAREAAEDGPLQEFTTSSEEEVMGDIAARPEHILAGFPRIHTPEEVEAWIESRRRKKNHVNIEVSNAGIFIDGRQVSEREFEEILVGCGLNIVHNHGRLLDIDADMLKKYCDNARAYGWEIGARGIEPVEQVISQEGNPFVNPDWDAKLKKERTGWVLSANDDATL